MMTSEKTFDYLVAWLVGAMRQIYLNRFVGQFPTDKELDGFGFEDKKFLPPREFVLGEMVDIAVCRGVNHFILSSESTKDLYVYNGECYEVVDGLAFIVELLKRVFRELNIGLWYQKRSIRQIAYDCYCSILSSEEFSYRPTRRYIVFTNGVLDLKSGKFNDFSPRYVTDICLDIAYNSRASFLLWDEKLKEIIPNKSFREAFQDFCGSLLIDRDEIKVEYICYIVGPGSNGKSVAAGAIAAVFGDRYFSRFSPKQLFKDPDARVNIAALQGKIANLVGDLEAKDISGGDFKRFISGEKFQGRRNYQEPILVTAPPLLCCANELPDTADDSYGHHRRQLPIYSTQRRWTEQDKDPLLLRKLSTPEARTYIFNWIYEGYRRIMSNGGNIKLGQEVVEAQEALRESSSPIRRWFRDCQYCPPSDLNGREWIPLNTLFEDYCTYCHCMREQPKPGDNRAISRMLKDKGYRVEKKRLGMAFYMGIKTNDDYEPRTD